MRTLIAFGGNTSWKLSPFLGMLATVILALCAGFMNVENTVAATIAPDLEITQTITPMPSALCMDIELMSENSAIVMAHSKQINEEANIDGITNLKIAGLDPGGGNAIFTSNTGMTAITGTTTRAIHSTWTWSTSGQDPGQTAYSHLNDNSGTVTNFNMTGINRAILSMVQLE